MTTKMFRETRVMGKEEASGPAGLSSGARLPLTSSDRGQGAPVFRCEGTEDNYFGVLPSSKIL